MKKNNNKLVSEVISLKEGFLMIYFHPLFGVVLFYGLYYFSYMPIAESYSIEQYEPHNHKKPWYQIFPSFCEFTGRGGEVGTCGLLHHPKNMDLSEMGFSMETKPPVSPVSIETKSAELPISMETKPSVQPDNLSTVDSNTRAKTDFQLLEKLRLQVKSGTGSKEVDHKSLQAIRAQASTVDITHTSQFINHKEFFKEYFKSIALTHTSKDLYLKSMSYVNKMPQVFFTDHPEMKSLMAKVEIKIDSDLGEHLTAKYKYLKAALDTRMALQKLPPIFTNPIEVEAHTYILFCKNLSRYQINLLTEEQFIHQLHTEFDKKMILPKVNSIQDVSDIQSFNIKNFSNNYMILIKDKSDVNEIKQLTLKYVEENMPEKFLAKTPKDFQDNSHPHVKIVDQLRYKIKYSGNRDERAVYAFLLAGLSTYNASLVSKPPAAQKEIIINNVFDNMIKSLAPHVEQGPV
jgi:hypothetical protein